MKPESELGVTPQVDAVHNNLLTSVAESKPKTGSTLKKHFRPLLRVVLAGLMFTGAYSALSPKQSATAEDHSINHSQTLNNDINPTEVRSYQFSQAQVLTPDTVFGIATLDSTKGLDRRTFLVKAILQQDGTLLTKTLKSVAPYSDFTRAATASEDGNTIVVIGADQNKQLGTYTFTTRANSENPDWQIGTTKDPLELGSVAVTPDSRYALITAIELDQPKSYLLRLNLASNALDRQWVVNKPGVSLGALTKITRLGDNIYRNYVSLGGQLYRVTYTDNQPPEMIPLGFVGLSGPIVEFNDNGKYNLLTNNFIDGITYRFINEQPAAPFTPSGSLYGPDRQVGSSGMVADPRPGIRLLVLGVSEFVANYNSRPHLELASIDTPEDLSTHRLVEDIPSAPKQGTVNDVGLLHTPDNRIWRFFQSIDNFFFDNQSQRWNSSGSIYTRTYVDGQFVGDWRQEVLSIPASQQASQVLFFPMVGRNLIR